MCNSCTKKIYSCLNLRVKIASLLINRAEGSLRVLVSRSLSPTLGLGLKLSIWAGRTRRLIPKLNLELKIFLDAVVENFIVIYHCSTV